MNILIKASILTCAFAFSGTSLAADIAKNFAPSYSPDGKYLTYYSYRGDQSPDIYIANSDGTNERRVTVNENIADIEPVWSADGTRIFYASGETQKSLNLFSADASGKNLKQHTFTEDNKGIKGKSIGPDGRQFVFSRVANNGGYEIVMASLDGGNEGQTKVLVPAASESEKNLGVDWQPSGDKIMFLSNREGREDNDIYFYDLKTDTVERLTDIDGSIMFPRWSSDGKSITFSANLSGKTNDIFSIGSDGGKLVNLTKDGSKSQYFSWLSEEQDTLLYDSGDWKSGFQIFAMHLKDGKTQALTSL